MKRECIPCQNAEIFRSLKWAKPVCEGNNEFGCSYPELMMTRAEKWNTQQGAKVLGLLPQGKANTEDSGTIWKIFLNQERFCPWRHLAVLGRHSRGGCCWLQWVEARDPAKTSSSAQGSSSRWRIIQPKMSIMPNLGKPHIEREHQ